MKKTTTIAIAALTALSATTLAGVSIELGDGNSTATFSDGQYAWTVDGTEHLFAQEFYYRRAGFNDEQSLSTMTLLSQTASDTNPFSDPRDNVLNSIYTDNDGLEIATIFTLTGGTNGSGNAALAEQITMTNTGTSTIYLSFFQYVNFDLGGDSGDDWGQIINGNTAQQFDNDFALSETVATPAPTLFQMGDESNISDFWSNGVTDNLNGDDAYQGDVAWAFQWDIELEAGDSFLISKNKLISIVPAPGSTALLAAAGLLATRRRRS